MGSDGPGLHVVWNEAVLLPAGDPHAWFHEITGVATFALAMAASYFALRLASAQKARQR